MSLERFVKTKIIVTLGPATEASEQLERLVEAGVDVFRLNMSHLDHAKADLLIDRIRAISDRVAIMADLQGPKMRLTDVDEVFELSAGDRVTVRAGDGVTTPEALYVPAGDLVATTGQQPVNDVPPEIRRMFNAPAYALTQIRQPQNSVLFGEGK